jgi:hypothetical protein
MKHTTLKTRDQGKANGEMSCPNCESAIAVTFQALLVDGKLKCKNPICRTVLHLNQAQSQSAMSAMRELQDGLKDIG